MGPIVDLEADRGEGFDAYLIDDDVAPLNIQSSANIACGFPAGERKYHDGRMRTMEGNLRAPQFARPGCFTRGPGRLFAYDGTDSASRTHGWLPKLGGLHADRDRVQDGALVCPAVAIHDLSGIVNGNVRWSALRRCLDARAPRNDQRGVRLPA